SPRDRHMHDVAEKLADRRVRSVTSTLEVGNQRGQTRSNQSTPLDARWQRCVMGSLAAGTPTRLGAMLRDGNRHRFNLDLLYHTGRGSGWLKALATARANL